VNDNIWEDVSGGCTYKEFLACNSKEYNGKGGAIVYTHWIKKMKSVHDISGCRDSQRVKYIVGLFVSKALTWWNYEIHTRGREADVGKSWEDFRTLTREEFCPSVHATDYSPEVSERTAVETILNMSPKNKEHYQSKKEAIHLLLTEIEDEIYSTVDACKTAHNTWIAIERL
nr:reverse transcriptase domain-containing protein [Tanacetum cinerariifolium]